MKHTLICNKEAHITYERLRAIARKFTIPLLASEEGNFPVFALRPKYANYID